MIAFLVGLVLMIVAGDFWVGAACGLAAWAFVLRPCVGQAGESVAAEAPRATCCRDSGDNVPAVPPAM